MWRHRPIKPRQEQNRRKTNADRTARPLTRRHNCSVDKFRLLDSFAINAVARHDYGLLDVALCHSIGRDSAIGKQNFASVTCDNPERPRLKMYPSLLQRMRCPWRYGRGTPGHGPIDCYISGMAICHRTKSMVSAWGGGVGNLLGARFFVD